MKNVPTKSTGQGLKADEFNPSTAEAKNLVTSSGQSLIEADEYQTAKAVADYSSVGDFYQDTGTANNYVVDAIAPRQGIPSYEEGQRIRFVPANTNTTASNINVQSVGNVSLLNYEGGALIDGEIQAGDGVEIENDGSNWRLVNGLGLAGLFCPIDGLTTSNNAAAPNTHIDFAVGRCADSNRNFLIKNITAGFNKNMTTNWVAGTGNGGKASAISITPSTWYYVFALSKGDGTFDAGIDTSIIAANLLADTVPSGYNKWRRIWAIYTLPTTSFIRRYHQYGNKCLWYTPISTTAVEYVQNGVNSGSTYTAPLIIPSGINVLSSFRYTIFIGSGANVYLRFFNNNQQDLPITSSPILPPLVTFPGTVPLAGRDHIEYMSAKLSQIKFRVATVPPANPACDVHFWTMGYTDFRNE